MYNTYLYNQPLYNVAAQLAPRHFLLDGSYRTASWNNNRVMVLSKDMEGNPVSGADENTTEIGLVGERLDFKLQPLVTTADLAEQVAQAAIAKARLEGKAGFVTLPPNCAVELWDVITIYDLMAEQEGINFRVTGIRLAFDARQQRFVQQFQLGDV